jgi:hypothetical protein
MVRLLASGWIKLGFRLNPVPEFIAAPDWRADIFRSPRHLK